MLLSRQFVGRSGLMMLAGVLLATTILISACQMGDSSGTSDSSNEDMHTGKPVKSGEASAPELGKASGSGKSENALDPEAGISKDDGREDMQGRGETESEVSESESGNAIGGKSAYLSELERKTFEDPYAAILHGIEIRILDLMLQAVDHKIISSMPNSEPMSEEIRQQLLQYASDSVVDIWAWIYEHDPGWLHEPQGLIATEALHEPSLSVEERSEHETALSFLSRHAFEEEDVEYIRYNAVLARADDSWKLVELTGERHQDEQTM